MSKNNSTQQQSQKLNQQSQQKPVEQLNKAQQQKQELVSSNDYAYFKTDKCAKCKLLGVFICEHDTTVRNSIQKSYAEEGIYHSTPRKLNENAIDYTKFIKSSTSNTVYAKNSSTSNGSAGTNGSNNYNNINAFDSTGNKGVGQSGKSSIQKSSKISNGSIPNGSVNKQANQNGNNINNVKENGATKKEENKGGCCNIM